MGLIEFSIGCLTFVIIFIIGITIGAICIIPVFWWINKIIIPLWNKIVD